MPPPDNERGRDAGYDGAALLDQDQTQEDVEHSAEYLRAQLIAAGVSADVDADIRCASIMVRSDGSFDFAETGPLAVLVPIDPDNPSDDCVAFFVPEPRRWWCYRAAPILNPEAIERAAWFKTPLRLHETPLDYLRAGVDGAVILNWRESPGLWLGGVAKIECPSAKYQRYLASALDPRPSLPRLVISEPARNAA